MSLQLLFPSLDGLVDTGDNACQVDRIRNQAFLTEEGTRFLVDAKPLVALSLESVSADWLRFFGPLKVRGWAG